MQACNPYKSYIWIHRSSSVLLLFNDLVFKDRPIPEVQSNLSIIAFFSDLVKMRLVIILSYLI